ncbi:PilW family protein [Pseudomonas turukhanskensis]|uniref:Type IV pilus assembly protein PilW n=1 Tax=Pseudomonas turukhanskensis TaxID=1806536 RepID=A0A9W6KAY9_9PSED|nr:PilW family protein [Pseudomonas turukhanskensis]GLK90724.1 hypothetical protein GCM10017655_37880 [Pseudomonas turukhanskensis]
MRPTAAFAQKGLSLIELMVAMLLALILIGGVVQIFLSSRLTYSTTSALSAVQESGRFASEFLAFDIRNAAYKGECLAPINNLTGLTDARFTLDLGLEGWDNSETSLPTWFDADDRLEGTDIILLKHAVNSSGAVVNTGETVAPDDTEITLAQASGIPTGTVLVASDPIGCDIFLNQSANTDSAVSRETSGTFSHDYADDLEILSYQSAVYFIKAGAAGEVPSLWRIRYNNGSAGMAAEQMVEGVQDMQIQYAVGDANLAITGDYVDADDITDWSKVVSARFSLLVVSRDANVVAQNQVISFNGADVTIENRRLAQVFTSTVGIRNRLP